MAIGGLALLTVLLVLASVLPDPARLAPDELAEMEASRPWTLAVARRFPAGRVLDSPWLVTVPVLLGLAIAWNLVERVVERQRRTPLRAEGRFRAQIEWSEASPPMEAVTRLRGALRRGGYRVAETSEDDTAVVVGRRGDLGFWGSLVFHVGLVVALVAVVLTMVAEWRGELQLVEGQVVALDAPGAVAIQRLGPLGRGPPHLVVRLDRVEARYLEDRFAVDYRAELAVLDDSGALRTGTVRVNQPISVEGQRFFLQRYGVAPVLEVRRGRETPLAGPVVLSVLGGREDRFDVPGTRDRIAVRWFGDHVREPGGVRSRSDEPRRPALGLSLEPGPPGSAARPMLLPLGEETSLGPYRVAFRELRRWASFGVDRDPGTLVLFAALVLAAAGLAVRFWDHEREIRVRIASDGNSARVAAAGRSRYFPALMAREVERLRLGP